MCCELQRHEIDLSLKVSIDFNSFLKQNFISICCVLQRHEINSIKVSFSHEEKNSKKDLLELLEIFLCLEKYSFMNSWMNLYQI